jgi:nucleotide-binding universal stress UspA family protein
MTVQLKRILCPIDFSDLSRQALDVAVALSRWCGASVSVMYVHRQAVPTFAVGPFIAPEAFQPIALTDAERAHLLQGLRDFVVKQHEARVSIEILLEESVNVAEAIVGRAQTLGVDLIVLGTHGRSGLERWTLGSIAEKVLRIAQSPVLVVPPRATEVALTGIAGVICPIDFSSSSKQALEFAASLAAKAGARLSVVHVLELLHEIGDVPVPDFDAYRAARFEKARKSMTQAVAPVRQMCPVDELVLAGKPYREIVRLIAEQHAGLVVMGVRGRGAIDRMFFGSTTEHVVRQAACPVLTIRGD